LFIIYYKELFHRSLWGVPKVPPGWDPRNKIEKIFKLNTLRAGVRYIRTLKLT